MNYISPEILQQANEEAIYNLYLYLVPEKSPVIHQTFQAIISELELTAKENKDYRSSRDFYRLSILRNAIDSNTSLANSMLSNLTRSKRGLTACCFTKPDGSVSVAFKGTGSGEWLDNGKGLSGIPEENTYITYGKSGRAIYRKTVHKDYATDQQVEALNWFNQIAAKNGWSTGTPIWVSGHSKGGNKAQFISMHSELVTGCYSFDGQGFSPEALNALKKELGEQYEKRRKNIMSFSADNDYVNVLGKRLAPEENIYYFDSFAGIHFIEAIIGRDGLLRPQCEQGRLSGYVQAVSEELMSLPPAIRQYAALGVMNVFQKYLGKEPPINEDMVSTEKTIAGIAVALAPFLSRFHT